MRVPDVRAGSCEPTPTAIRRREFAVRPPPACSTFVLGLAGLRSPGGQSGNGTKRDRLIMDTEMPNKAVVARWYASFWGASCDPAIVDELAAPDVLVQYSMHNSRRGRPAVKAFMAGFRAAFPDFDFRGVGAPVADRDIVVVRWEGSGIHAGPAFHDFGIGPPPAGSGRKITLSGHTAVRLENGMIAEEAVWSMERKARLRPITGGLVSGLSAGELASA